MEQQGKTEGSHNIIKASSLPTCPASSLPLQMKPGTSFDCHPFSLCLLALYPFHFAFLFLSPSLCSFSPCTLVPLLPASFLAPSLLADSLFSSPLLSSFLSLSIPGCIHFRCLSQLAQQERCWQVPTPQLCNCSSCRKME